MRFSSAIRVPPNLFRVPAAPPRLEAPENPEPVTAQAAIASPDPAGPLSQPADLDQRVRQSGEW